MKLQIKKFKVLSNAIYWIYILIAFKLLLFQILNCKSKIVRK